MDRIVKRQGCTVRMHNVTFSIQNLQQCLLVGVCGKQRTIAILTIHTSILFTFSHLISSTHHIPLHTLNNSHLGRMHDAP